jgi:hypothetical protein
MSSRPARLVAVALLLAGCRDLERFDTEDGAAYCGSMVSANFLHEGFIPGGSSRPNMQMRLELDTDELATFPGRVWTDDTAGLCSPAPILQGDRLRAIEEVQNDALSLLEFGDGRDFNFFAWVDSTCQGTLLAIVSLMKTDDVELRLLKARPVPAANAGTADQPGFIVFQLKRRDSGCSF